MTQIEKMFENANIKPKKEGYCDWDSDCPYPDIINSGCGNECPYWKYKDEANYPPFTAEKQLLLIKWLVKTRPIHISFLFGKWIIEGMGRYGDKYDTFEDALSGYINHIWQLLTDQDKEEIRRILNE